MRHLLLAILLLLATPALALEAPHLKAMMKKMEKDYKVLKTSLQANNFPLAAYSAEAIANHATPPFGEKMKVMWHFGSSVPKFKELNEANHNLGIQLAAAARQSNEAEAQRLAGLLVKNCAACHQLAKK